VEFLKSQSSVKKNRIGSIGWCMGGGYSLNVALREPTLVAAVINYGHLADDPASLKKINAAVLGIFGGQDRGIPVDDVKKFEETLKQQGKKIEIVIYPTRDMPLRIPTTRQAIARMTLLTPGSTPPASWPVR
jgi:carboxymethylenebutenolidase